MRGIACRTFLDIMCFRFVAYSPVFALSEDEVTQPPYPRVPSLRSVTRGYVCSPPSGMQSRTQHKTNTYDNAATEEMQIDKS